MHPAIARMARAQMRIYRSRTPAMWIRHDGPEDGDPIDVMFLSTGTEVSEDGFQMQTGEPVAEVVLADALAIAPARAGVESEVFHTGIDGDVLVVNGIRHRVESCSPDGYGRLKIDLRRTS